MADLTLAQYRLVRTLPSEHLTAVSRFLAACEAAELSVETARGLIAVECESRAERQEDVLETVVPAEAPAVDLLAVNCRLCGKDLHVGECLERDLAERTEPDADPPAPAVAPTGTGYSRTLDLTCEICSAPYAQTILRPSEERKARKTCSEACRKEAQRRGGRKAHRARQTSEDREDIHEGTIPLAEVKAGIRAMDAALKSLADHSGGVNEKVAPTRARGAEKVTCDGCGRKFDSVQGGICASCRMHGVSRRSIERAKTGDAASDPPIEEDIVIGDGTGGLEEGKRYHRKLYPAAGWADDTLGDDDQTILAHAEGLEGQIL